MEVQMKSLPGGKSACSAFKTKFKMCWHCYHTVKIKIKPTQID